MVNTASNCGFTGQYDELEKLHQQYKDKLVILGFPANDFKEQEKADDAGIAEFCKVNFGATFQLMLKSHVVKGAEQNPVFAWLSHKEQNGWCDQQPVWNFSKYLVNENGVLVGFYAQTVSPMSKEIKKALEGVGVFQPQRCREFRRVIQELNLCSFCLLCVKHLCENLCFSASPRLAIL